ncbi:MAG: restriction endonuclease subunit S [Gammaproteobacteria bacterium]|nr:restriction endonuclease subunit S [Gammaproteobacteria bacterium]
MSAVDLITDHLDIWTTAQAEKVTGRGKRTNNHSIYGIKKLRELILELAVRGKLVPQDPTDEPASVLLHKISEQRARLAKSGKTNKQKSFLNVSDNEKQFGLPSGWAWFRVGNVLNFQYGKAMAAKHRDPSGNVDVYGSNGIVGKHSETLIKAPCIVIGRKGSAGALNKACGPSWITDVAYFLVPPDGFNFDYTYLILKSLRLDRLGKGIKPGVNRNEAYALVASLPPLSEQHRIVAKVDELMTLCDQLEQQQTNSNATHQTLVETLLATLTRPNTGADGTESNAIELFFQHFDTLFTTEQSIDQLKQTILQLAVMGRLVPRDPDDEPASFLLENLSLELEQWLMENVGDNKECATMLRKLNKLDSPAPPFDIPKSWATAHLLQISRVMVDCHNKTAPYVDKGIPIIRTSNIRQRRFKMDGMKYVDQVTYDYWSRRCPPEPGDLIFTREAPMGEAAIIPKEAKYCLGQRTMLIRPMHDYVSKKYLLLALTEPHLLERASEHAIGSTVKHLRVGDVENLSVPIPPLAEQHRIAAKVDELMALCNTLKVLFIKSQTTQLQLADTIVEQALP